MNHYQTTLKQQVVCSGIGLHLGKETSITFKPAPADTGIVFVRTDVQSRPRIKACLENVRQVEEQSRRTTLGHDYYDKFMIIKYFILKLSNNKDIIMHKKSNWHLTLFYH